MVGGEGGEVEEAGRPGGSSSGQPAPLPPEEEQEGGITELLLRITYSDKTNNPSSPPQPRPG